MHNDKTIVPLEINAIFLADHKILSQCLDISGRKDCANISPTTLGSKDRIISQPEQNSITESESLLAALDNMTFAVVIEDEYYNIRYENLRMRKAFGGYTGNKCYKSYFGRDKPCRICPVKEILHGSKINFVYDTTVAGKVFEVNASRFQNADGTFSIIQALVDVTERKRLADEILANQQLRASEQQLRAANQQLAAKEQALLVSQNALTTKVAELERFNKLMVGRELDMIKLKEQINSLLEEMGRAKKYDGPASMKGL